MFRWFPGRKTTEQDRRDRFRAIPVQNPEVERTVLDDGRIILRGQTAVRGLGRLLGAASVLRQFELDGLGDWVWQHCDGQMTAEDLVRGFARDYVVNVREAEISVISFLNILARKNLIAFVVGRENSAVRRRRRKR